MTVPWATFIFIFITFSWNWNTAEEK